MSIELGAAVDPYLYVLNADGKPGEVSFRTKPRVAQGMRESALDGGVPFTCFAGDAVYGSDRNLRIWLERQGLPSVLDVKSNEKLFSSCALLFPSKDYVSVDNPLHRA